MPPASAENTAARAWLDHFVVWSESGERNGHGQSFPLGTTLAGATVVMGAILCRCIFASNGQINAVVPAGININTSQQIVVQRGNTLSVPISVDVGPAEPAIFTYPVPGDPPNQGAIVNALTYVVAQPGTPVTAGNPIAIFCTGLGAVDQTVPDGAAAPSPPANTWYHGDHRRTTRAVGFLGSHAGIGRRFIRSMQPCRAASRRGIRCRW